FKVGAVYLVPVLKRYYGICTNHMRVYRVMKEEGLLYHKARKRFRRRYIPAPCLIVTLFLTSRSLKRHQLLTAVT
ncbi:MAG TPA: hypothetical protein VND40_03040, partial [Nitrososphaerales archaeon]|nr:hypothetical protein [Nitrososphaerales archaeon]